MTSKRYVLLLADGDVTPEGWGELVERLGVKYGKVKPIPVKENRKALVLKTDDRIASQLRGENGAMNADGRRVSTVLTSGSIGKLKRAALAT
jgi:hypothetical protein